MLNIDLYRENLQKSSYLKPEGHGIFKDFLYIATLSGPLPRLLTHPKHVVLGVSYCDHHVSVVHRPSWVVHNLLQMTSPP